MTTGDKGVVSVSYRPLGTMDELHVLILAGVAAEPEAGDVGLLEQAFSLPATVVSKELATLAAYGLAQRSGRGWSATGRGRRIAEVWHALGRNHTVEVPATGRQWLLGPGEFAVDEMIRDGSEVATKARAFGVAEPDAAVKFLNDRRAAAEKFDSFVRGWSPGAVGEGQDGQFGETPLFKALAVAETDEALTRLDELFHAQVHAVVARREESLGATADTIGAADDPATKALKTLKTQGQQLLKKFDGERRGQRRRNQQLAVVRSVCEANLAGRWLAAGVRPLAGVFESEPAAFVFQSNVPLVGPDAPPPHPASTASSPPNRGQDGLIRSFFRWLFG